jgi:serine/threonine protein kinase/tetratricopeptide (TPR) repeat protein
MFGADERKEGRDDLERGSVVAGYRIDDLISRGGMGIVYRATSLELGRVYALKVLAPEVAGNEEFRQRFRREIRVAAALRHPNVVTVHHADEHEGLLFLVMDLITGSDLRKLIRHSGPLEAHRATALLAQVASALDAAHDRGIVHRDVKPANILIATGGGVDRAYVTDFGLAKRFDGDASTALTRTGVVVGTVEYMSPEQITGRRTDGRADIYALGCVYFEMLTGAVPYAGRDSLMGTLFAHVHEPPPSLGGRLAELYPQLGAVLERAMAKEPADRHRSAGEFADDAADALHGLRRHTARTLGAAERPSSAQPVRAPDAMESPSSHETRRVVSVLCCRVTPTTLPGEQPDHDRVRAAIRRSAVEIQSVIDRHRGIAETLAGDDVTAVFGLPRAREDDAVRAVRAAAEVGERVSAVAGEVGVGVRARIGIDTGRLLAGEAKNRKTGDPMDVAAILQKRAGAGEILLTSETLRLVRDAVEVEPLEPLALAGGSDPVPAFRLERIDPNAPGLARRFDIPFVGRERELRLLREAWGRAVEERGCHLFTVLGEAGVGKSRLVAELLNDVGGAGCVLRGRCLPYGEGITFWPVTEALAPLGDVVRPVIDRLRGGGVAAPEELFLAVRRLLESLAAKRPVILHVDDLQWAEPMLLDLLDHVADLSRVAPILVLCAARLELLDLRPGWGGGKLNATTALLGPLGAADAEALLDELSDELDPEIRSPLLSASDGNPLFLEEMVALAREAGSVTVPPTIEALLAERLERLPGEERGVLERAAVEGEVFHRNALASLAGERLTGTLDSSLSSLVRKELIRPHPATLDAGDAFRFRHLLIRDAAYDALSEDTRAGLHERFADWLEASAPDVAELDELAGWHLERAVTYGEEPGEPIEPGLAARAAAHLHAAGRRARDRGDLAAARSLLERAFALAPPADMPQGAIGVDLAECLIEAGEVARADELLSAAELEAGAEPLAALARFEWMIRVRPHEAVRTIEFKLPGILRQLAATDDESGMARAHLVSSMPHWLACRWTLAGEQARLAAEHAEKAGDEGMRSRALAFYIGSIVYGDADVMAIRRELDAIERNEPGASLAARLELARGQLARIEGDFTEARVFMQRALEGFQALGMRELEAACDHELGLTELSAGDPAAALPWLFRSDALLAELGQHFLRSTTQAVIAQTQVELGNGGATRTAIELAERLSAPEDIVNFAITHRVRARLALSEQNTEGAVRWARSAVAHALRTDLLELRGDATLDLARVLAALGRRDDAVCEARAALEIFSAKGHRPGIDNARALLDELDAGA